MIRVDAARAVNSRKLGAATAATLKHRCQQKNTRSQSRKLIQSIRYQRRCRSFYIAHKGGSDQAIALVELIDGKARRSLVGVAHGMLLLAVELIDNL